MGYMFYYFLKKFFPRTEQTKKVFKSIRDVPFAFNNVSTATDYNFKATELRWFLSIALRIPTAHDFCVIGARKWARARTQRKKFPSS